MEDWNELLEWAENGDRIAQEKIGTAYLKGKSVEKDVSKALEYFEKAAENGSGFAYYQIGKAYEKGNGRAQNIDTALDYYEKSAELGYVNAQNVLKQLREPGGGTAQSIPATNTIAINQIAYAAPSLPVNNVPSFNNKVIGKQKSKTVAAVLAIFLGFLGVHNFYLGFIVKGVIQLVLSLTVVLSTFSAIWALVEFIMILTGSISCDSKGIALK